MALLSPSQFPPRDKRTGALPAARTKQADHGPEHRGAGARDQSGASGAGAGAPAAAPPRHQEALPDVVCFSHLRWDFVFQRPQHLLTRFADQGRVYYVEEPLSGPVGMEISRRAHGLRVVTPRLPHGLSDEARTWQLRMLIERMFAEEAIADPLLWFYTPMALPWTQQLRPRLVVYDCMDELSAFAGAPPEMCAREAQLLAWSNLVFTGGHSLYAAKRDQHPQVHAFPSSIDQRHFQQARAGIAPPRDQRLLPQPRAGFYGVVDERFDVELLAQVAQACPHWQFIIIGPVVKIDPSTLPRLANIHYLGQKSYEELPAYLSGWDVALLPFAHNASTRFISPTKTPEYLSAGRPVVSTSIRDVVRPYGELGLVHIADGAEAFARALDAARAQGQDAQWRARVDTFLQGTSWDRTWGEMRALLRSALKGRTLRSSTAPGSALPGISLENSAPQGRACTGSVPAGAPESVRSA